MQRAQLGETQPPSTRQHESPPPAEAAAAHALEFGVDRRAHYVHALAWKRGRMMVELARQLAVAAEVRAPVVELRAELFHLVTMSSAQGAWTLSEWQRRVRLL